jgi:hypothetical protein
MAKVLEGNKNNTNAKGVTDVKNVKNDGKNEVKNEVKGQPTTPTNVLATPTPKPTEVKGQDTATTPNTVSPKAEPTVTKADTTKTDVKAESKPEVKTDVKNEVKTDVKAEDKGATPSAKAETPKNDTPNAEAKPSNAKADNKADNKPKGTKDSEEKTLIPFARATRIDKSNKNYTIKQLFKLKDKLRFDLAIQRNEVWSLDQKSMLIHSILYGYPVPPVMVQETDDDNLWFLDGKQRLTTIISFLNGEWALSKKTPAVFGHEIKGHKFADLQEDMRDEIQSETLTLVKLKHMSEEEVDQLFVRWNSGSALSKIELTRAMHSELIEQINYIAELEFFADDIALTGKARNRFVDQEIILQIAMLLDEGKDNIKGFGSTQISDYVLRLKETKQVLADELIKKFELTSHYLNMAVASFDYSERTKALKKIHVPMIFFTAQKAMELKVKPNIFGEFIRNFLITNYSVESDYGQSCQSGSSKKDNVLIRLFEMGMDFEEYLKNIEETAKNAKTNEVNEKGVNATGQATGKPNAQTGKAEVVKA